MARKLKSDRVLFIATILLVGLSVVMVYSASAVVMMEKFQRPYLFLTKQAMWAVLGVVLLSVVMRIDYHHYKRQPLIWLALACSGLALFAVLFSPPINNARRWFALGGGQSGGGTVSLASNVVIQTLGNGRLKAFTADKGEPLLDLAQLHAQTVPQPCVQIGKRLVQQENRGLHHEAARQGHALHLPPAQQACAACGQFGHAHHG